jgi:hypothetical protein
MRSAIVTVVLAGLGLGGPVVAANAATTATAVAHAEHDDSDAFNPPAWPKQRCTVDRGPVHFRTSAGAMRYLARAYNCFDIKALRHVTNPAARLQLQYMTAEGINMRFDACDSYRYGSDYHTYTCHFTHDYPKGVEHETPDANGNGQAWLQVYPADNPGWYATVVGCG